jgi:cobalt-zinc-cadmium efflux system membrane fusion protein
MNRYASFLTLIALLNLLTGFSACTHSEATVPELEEGFSLSDTMLREIKLDTVRFQPVRGELTLSGQIATNGDRTAKVFPLVGGVVEDLRVELGDYVQKGQVLAVVRSGEIADLQNQSSTAGTDLDIARKNLAVAEDQLQAGLASERDVVLARKELQKAESNVGKSRKQMGIYGVTADGKYAVRAPVSGFITEKNVTENMQYTNENVDHFFTIANLDDVWIMANVFESDIANVREGYTADVTTLAYPDKHFTGRIDKVFNVLDPESKVMKVRVRLKNPDFLLKPQMYAQIKVQNTENRRMLAVPSQAVIFDKDRNFLMVYRDRKRIDTHEVKVYKTVAGLSYVESGVQPGDVVISKNQLLVYDQLND